MSSGLAYRGGMLKSVPGTCRDREALRKVGQSSDHEIRVWRDGIEAGRMSNAWKGEMGHSVFYIIVEECCGSSLRDYSVDVIRVY